MEGSCGNYKNICKNFPKTLNFYGGLAANKWEVFLMKQKIEVKTLGEPTTDGLSESEKVAFYTTLYKRIIELSRGGK